MWPTGAVFPLTKHSFLEAIHDNFYWWTPSSLLCSFVFKWSRHKPTSFFHTFVDSEKNTLCLNLYTITSHHVCLHIRWPKRCQMESDIKTNENQLWIAQNTEQDLDVDRAWSGNGASMHLPSTLLFVLNWKSYLQYLQLLFSLFSYFFYVYVFTALFQPIGETYLSEHPLLNHGAAFTD